MGTHKHHRYLTGARKAKADEFYTTYDAIDRELSHYRHAPGRPACDLRLQ